MLLPAVANLNLYLIASYIASNIIAGTIEMQVKSIRFYPTLASVTFTFPAKVGIKSYRFY